MDRLIRVLRLKWISFACFVLTMTVAVANAQDIKTELFVDQIDRPIFMTQAPGDNTRFFIVEQHSAAIKIYKPASGQITTFIDIDSASNVTIDTGNEQGLLGLAFDPNYQSNGRFYVYYTRHDRDTVVARYTRTNADSANTNTRVQLLTFNQPRPNHNGGWMGFGPDGYLYIASGDGGSQNDPDNNGQNKASWLGKILRIDVNGSNGQTSNYGIPASNPTAKFPSRPEIWAYGLRNPWRCSFDKQTGDFIIGDVGQTLHEEINFQNAGFAGGANYGWRLREGFVANPNTSVANPNIKIGGPKPSDNVDPVIAISRGESRSVTAGYVYRGTAIPALQGQYFYADYVSARVWSMNINSGGNGFTNRVERTSELQPQNGSFVAISSFAEDHHGELYICILQTSDADNTGSIHKIVSAQANEAPNITTTAVTNSFIGQSYTYDVDATGVPEPTFSLVTNPSGMTINNTTGVISWSPTSSGNFNVTVRASNSEGQDNQSFVINVDSLRVPENPIETLDEVRYYYYEKSFSQLPDFDNETPKRIGLDDKFDLSERDRNNNFAFKFEGYVDVPQDGYYTFFTESDDGSRLLIGSQVVVDNDGFHGMQERSGVIGLEQGKHAITVLYFQGGGGRGLNVRWQGPSVSKQIIPASRLYADPDTKLEPYLDGVFPTAGTGTMPQTLSETGAFDDLGNMTPRFGILPYKVNSQLWSDGAVKTRWLALAHGETIAFREQDEWDYPAGTVFIKHFELQGTSTKKLETRFLVLTPSGSYGVTYRWRDDGSDADILTDADNNGAKGLTVNVSVPGTTNTQWTFPSRAACLECHTTAAKFVLGPNKTRQLNGTLDYPIVGTRNQLTEFNNRGLFNTNADTFDNSKLGTYDKMHEVADATQTLEHRVRSYLDANCANCHRPGGAPAEFNAIFHIPLAESNLINGNVNNDLGVAGSKVVVPKNVPLSVLHARVDTTNTEIMMPPIGRHLIDEQAEAVIREWIGSLGSPSIRTGSLTVSTEWQTVTLPESYEEMVVTTAIENTSANPPLVTRIRNASGNQFEVQVQRFDGTSGAIADITLHYLVMEAGTYTAAETGVRMEARRFTSTVTDRKGSWSGQALSYLQSYSNPVVLGQVMSFNDARPSAFWNRGSANGNPADASNLRVGKHVGEDTQTSRSNETLGIIVLESGSGTLKTQYGDIAYEAALGADTISGMNTNTSYALSFTATRALVNHSGMDGGDGGWAVLKEAPGNQLVLAIDEDMMGDSERGHTTEQVGYLALGEPIAQSPARIYTGEIDASTQWQTIPLPFTFDDMVVTTSIINTESNPPLITRIQNASGNQFQVKVQRFDGQTGSVSGVKLYWLAMEAGSYSAAQTGLKMEARTFNSTITDENNSWTGEGLSYLQSYTSPVILGQVMTENDARPSVFWNRGSSRTDPASASSLYVGKQVGEDPTVARNNETLGVIVLESGSGTLKTETGDIGYVAALGADTIQGMNTNQSYKLPLTANKAFVNQSGMDGNNGGWAVLKEVPSDEIVLAVDEDTLGDTERNHINEQIGYLALGVEASVESLGLMALNSVNTPGTFIAGINFGGPSVTIEGQRWLSHEAALNEGLTLGNHTAKTTTVEPEPKPEADAVTMLQSLVERYRNSLSLEKTLEDGNYDIYLWVMEYTTTPSDFDISLENQVKGEFKNKVQREWERLGPFKVDVTDGVLNLDLGSKVVGTNYSDTKVMGMAIYKP